MEVTNKVVRHSRKEMTTHDGEASAEIDAGQAIVENGDGTVSPGWDSTMGLLIAQDDRERGMIIGDSYASGEHVKYLDPSGGGLNVLLADGETLDPSTENRLAVNSNGYFEVYDSGVHAESDIAVRAATEDTIDTSGAPEPVPVEVI